MMFALAMTMASLYLGSVLVSNVHWLTDWFRVPQWGLVLLVVVIMAFVADLMLSLFARLLTRVSEGL
jgi:hypothetical protein